MSSAVALSGNDTVVINSRVLTDFADGNFATLAFPQGIAAVKTGKNGNSIYAQNESGKQADFQIRILRGSADDKFLNALLLGQQNNFAQTVLMVGEMVKQIGDGQGNITADTYIMSGGIFVTAIPAQSNAEGSTDQSVAVYDIKFANAPRVLT